MKRTTDPRLAGWADYAPAMVLGSMVGAGVVSLAMSTPMPTTTVTLDERPVTVLAPARPASTDAGEVPEAPEDAGPASERLRVARKVAPTEKREGSGQQGSDRAVAEDAGVLGALREGTGEIPPMDPGLLEGVGGLVGGKGVGHGGLGSMGSRGSGLGGGGTIDGLGGLGTRGAGTGASGYGRGIGISGTGRGAVVRRQRAVGSGLGGVSVVRGGAPAAAETWIDAGVHDVQLADQDHLSTFAVDVDTGSYTLARGTLRRGQRPHPGAVRVEEFVNAMDYALPGPSGDDPFAVVAELSPDPLRPREHLLRVALKGAEVDVEDRPARITFLVDVSCSMGGEMASVKRALRTAVAHAGPEDSFAIATYAGATRRVLAPTPASDRAALHRAIDGLRHGGGTAMGDGMSLAYAMARDHELDGAENRVMVLSDGDANIGASGHAAILRRIAEHAGQGITLSTVGFGRGNYRDGLMEQLADKGDGVYRYIDSDRELERVFGEDLGRSSRTIARDVKVQVAFDPDAVLAWRLIGYENRDVADADFRKDHVDGGEIGSGHEVTALYALSLAGPVDGPLARVHLRAKPPGKDAPAREWAVDIDAGDAVLEWADVTDDHRLATGVAAFAEILRDSPHAAEWTLDDVRRILAPLPAMRQVREVRELVDRAEPHLEPAGGAQQAGLIGLGG